MPELKCQSIRCHIPGLGFLKGSSVWPPDLPIPQAMKTCTRMNNLVNLDGIEIYEGKFIEPKEKILQKHLN